MNKEELIQNLRRTARRIDVHTHVGVDPANYRRGDFPYAQSAEDLLIRLDRWGMDAAVCFPFLYTDYFNLDAFIKGRLTKSRSGSGIPYANENANLCREVFEVCAESAGRLLPFMFFDPGRQPDDQAAVLRDLAAQYPVFGLKTATSYLRSHITELLGAGRVLLDFAAEKNLPVMLHSAVIPGDPWADVQAILQVIRARPDVRFCMAHTCRFDLKALDEANRLPNAFVDFSAFTIHCQLACQNSPVVAESRNSFPANYRDPSSVLAAITQAYPETMLWGTDSPYYTFMSRFINDVGETVSVRLHCGTDTEMETFRTLPDRLQAQIGCRNTLNFLFGTDTPATGD